MNQNYGHTITLYNRIRAADSPDKREHWFKTVLFNCFWKSVLIMRQGGTDGTKVNAVQVNAYTVRIPQDGRYVPYGEFIKSPYGHFTVSQDDIVVLGECRDEITGESGQMAAQVLNRHKPNAFKVTAFSDNTSFPIQKHYRLGG